MEGTSDDEYIKFSIELHGIEDRKIVHGLDLPYKISTSTNFPQFKAKEFGTVRKFSEFLGLHDRLVSAHLSVGRVIPPPPENHLIDLAKDPAGALASAQPKNDGISVRIKNQCSALERFLRYISRQPILCADPDYIKFLQSNKKLLRTVNSSESNDAAEGNDVIVDTGTNYEYYRKMLSGIESHLPNFVERLKKISIERENCFDAIEPDISVPMLVNSDAYILCEMVKDYFGFIIAIKAALRERIKILRNFKHLATELGVTTGKVVKSRAQKTIRKSLDKVIIYPKDTDTHVKIINELSPYSGHEEIYERYEEFRAGALKLSGITSGVVEEIKGFYVNYGKEFLSIIDKVLEHQESYKQQLTEQSDSDDKDQLAEDLQSIDTIASYLRSTLYFKWAIEYEEQNK